MPSQEQVDGLIAMVRAGQTLEAMRVFYADEATMQENQRPPRIGLPALLAHESKLLTSVQAVLAHPVNEYFIRGDEVVIHWVFDITDRNGRCFRLDELALQHWRGAKIVRERFFYDPAPVSIEAPPRT